MLMKLYRDLYYIVPLSADPETYSPDGRLVARCIMKGKGYYIAYSSAMYIHGLTDQPGARTLVVTDRQRQPSIKNIKGREFHFIYHTYRRFFGYRETWITTQEQTMVSDLEKTIVDAVSKPQRSVICFSPTFLNWNGHQNMKECLMTAEQAFHC